MARIRSVHPGLYTDEAFMTLSMAARVLIVGLWGHADDGGGFGWKPLVLKARIFPADNIDLGPILAELEENDVIKKYESSGKSYGAIRNFGKWQRPQKPKRFVPMPKPVREYCQSESICPDQENNNGHKQVRDEYNTGTQPVSDQSSNSSAEGRKVGRYEGNVGCNAHDAPTEKPIADRWQELAEDVIAATGNNPARSMVRADCVRQWLADASARGYSFETATEIILGTVREKSRFGGKGKPPAWFNSPVTQALASGTIPSAHIVGNAPKSRADRVADAWAGVPDIPGV